MVILVERGTGRNKHDVVVEWISAWCVCVVFSLSVFLRRRMYYIYVWFSLGLLSTLVRPRAGSLISVYYYVRIQSKDSSSMSFNRA